MIDVLSELDKARAVLLDRHFVYKSGKHGSGYINLDPIFPNVQLMREICKQLVDPFSGKFDTVAAPAIGGIELAILSAAAATSTEAPVAAIWADKDGNDFTFERAGFEEHLAGKRVLIVEDLLTTGDSVMKVIRRARELDAEIVGISVICNRGGVTADDLEVPVLEELAAVNFSATPASECQLCRAAVPIVDDIGHGKEFKQAHPDYPGGYVSVRGSEC